VTRSSETRGAVGFIGLGIMGRPMAGNLLAAGSKLVTWSRSSGSAPGLEADGARVAGSPAEVARSVDVLIVMVPDTADLEAVLDGPDGVLAGARAGLVVCAMGTHHPASMPPLAERCAEQGVAFLDAPVSGGEIGARDGSLSIMVGGDAAAFERARPVFEAMGRTVIHVGRSGAGQLAKACNQLIVGSTIAAVAEALTLARAGGADPAVVRAALAGGFAASRVLDVHGQRMIERDFEPGGRAALHAKDAHIILDTATALGLDLPFFAAVAEAFDRLVANGSGDLDHSALITLLDADPPV
jgi:2-hydroxy-3-oxopropionate reductase